jgi:hypothetical protein
MRAFRLILTSAKKLKVLIVFSLIQPRSSYKVQDPVKGKHRTQTSELELS